MIRKWGTVTCDFEYVRNTSKRRRKKKKKKEEEKEVNIGVVRLNCWVSGKEAK